ncbi:helix-turn-helix domain-containing protein [Massilia pinisoli]|uniref:Helix-turn-helix domain-containing protein n=1 Tax=Massilia pinisoli TaxID=1772194 RepID=A0ABT1ZXL0_9BURK|nr:helix-turn-helix transcriptional regulator [Massilia pinisoli]MCS0584605.1 helix-turn-helix domain-containing protein [Massilia pinisoli]
MSEVTQLLTTIKRQLKLQGKTYRDVAGALGLSEASVKRLLTSDSFGVDRLVEISNLLGFTLAELAQEAALTGTRLHTLSEAQEKELVSDTKLLLVAVCALNHWTVADILAVYRLTEAECVQKLLHLDRLHLIALMPGNRIRLNVARDFDWLSDGPIRRYFRTQGLADFLDGAFDRPDETLAFTHGMLTESALAAMQVELRRLRARFAELHEESLAAPLPKRRGSGLLLALREWEPAGFTALRR